MSSRVGYLELYKVEARRKGVAFWRKFLTAADRVQRAGWVPLVMEGGVLDFCQAVA